MFEKRMGVRVVEPDVPQVGTGGCQHLLVISDLLVRVLVLKSTYQSFEMIEHLVFTYIVR